MTYYPLSSRESGIPRRVGARLGCERGSAFEFCCVFVAHSFRIPGKGGDFRANGTGKSPSLWRLFLTRKLPCAKAQRLGYKATTRCVDKIAARDAARRVAAARASVYSRLAYAAYHNSRPTHFPARPASAGARARAELRQTAGARSRRPRSRDLSREPRRSRCARPGHRGTRAPRLSRSHGRRHATRFLLRRLGLAPQGRTRSRRCRMPTPPQ